MPKKLIAAPLSHHSKAIFFLMLATGLWGLSFPVAKALWMIQGGGDLTIAAAGIFIRFLLSGIILWVLLKTKIRSTKSEHKQAFLLAAAGGVGILLQMDALQYTSASTSAFLTQSYCMILPWFYCFNHKRFPSPEILGSTFLVVIGMLILCGVKWNQFNMGRGEYETLLASFIFTFQILVLEKKEFNKNKMARVSFWMFLWVAALMLVKIIFSGSVAFSNLIQAYSTANSWILIIVLTLFATVVSFTLMNEWQPHLDSVEAGLIYALEPLFASAYALFLPGLLAYALNISYANESLTKELVIGGSLITLANLWIQLAKKREKLDY